LTLTMSALPPAAQLEGFDDRAKACSRRLAQPGAAVLGEPSATFPIIRG
jgi:hypothetical protein